MRYFGIWIGAMAGTLQALAQPSAVLERQANSTLTLPATPPMFGFRTERAFGSLAFTAPVALASPPGETNRLFVVEQRGRIAVITNLANPTRTVFLDISTRVAGGTPPNEQGLLGLAFHPGHATNGYFFIFYTANTAGSPNRLSRFETSSANPNLALPNSEIILINQTDEAGNHNGGDLHFGPDGYLYVSLGDEGGANDNNNNSQRIDKDFFSGILRLDVDKRPGSLPPNAHPASSSFYAVPPDNPYVGAANFNGLAVTPNRVRTEFWAVGLRNPWRISFDTATGELYCGDVGQGSREEIDLIVGGGNYGWNYYEGTLRGPRTAPAGFVSLPPIHEYAHGSSTNQGNSVTGGLVYRGRRLSQLQGAYVFADYVSGNIWSLRSNGANRPLVSFLVKENGIAAFGSDPRNGDILLADQSDNTIKRLIYSSNSTGQPLPPTLAEAGAFADLASLKPHAGIVPYEINVPFWSDQARKKRWFSVPELDKKIEFHPELNWNVPPGTIWIKNFELELTNGAPESARRLETRFLVRNTSGIYGVTYRWDETQTNAVLVPEGGLDEELVIHDGGITRTQVWHYPSRGECLTCHTPVAGLALGFNTAQLNRETDLGAGPQNQLTALSQAGYFQSPVNHPNLLRALAHWTNNAFSLEYRVRSYLTANCVQCHQPGGLGHGFFDTRITTPLSQTALIDGPLHRAEHPDDRVVKPGQPERSALLQRISALGAGRMPPLGSNLLDTNAIELVRAWIGQDLAQYQSFWQWQITHFGSTNQPDSDLAADPDQDGGSNWQEYLAGTDPLSETNHWGITMQRFADAAEIRFQQAANRGFDVQVAETLFDPASWQSLAVPGNRPFFFAATNLDAVVSDQLTNSAARFYRVRIREP